MQSGIELLSLVASRYGELAFYSDAVDRRLGGIAVSTLDTSSMTRRFRTRFARGRGLRVEETLCVGGRETLVTAVVWDYSSGSAWSKRRGWEQLESLREVLNATQLIVPRLLIGDKEAVTTQLGVTGAARLCSDVVDNCECDVLDLASSAGAHCRVWSDKSSMVLRRVETVFGGTGPSYSGRLSDERIAEVDCIYDISFDAEVSNGTFLPLM